MNIDPVEIQKFESLAHRWWDPDGEFRPLHDINDLRMRYIADRAQLRGARVLEVGCGGGILTESLANFGANTTGIDPAHGPLSVAKLHAVEMGLENRISYIQTTAEEYVESNEASFDVVAALEILEHVPDFSQTVQALADLTKPGGHVFCSTINRHPIAYATAILGAEYLLNILPQGTHDYKKLIKPHELAAAARKSGLVVKNVAGYTYNPIDRSTSFAKRPTVNYLFHATKPC